MITESGTEPNVYIETRASESILIIIARSVQIVLYTVHLETLSALLTFGVGKPQLTGGFPSTISDDEGFDVFFGVSLNVDLRHRDLSDVSILAQTIHDF